jgi:transposase InsO family protein
MGYYQKVLMKKKVKCNMTESYDPYANAVAQCINGILKQEFNLEEYDVKLSIMRALIKDSIKVYNTRIPHLSCQMKTPE